MIYSGLIRIFLYKLLDIALAHTFLYTINYSIDIWC